MTGNNMTGVIMTDFWKFYCIIYDNDVILKQFDGDKYDGFSEKP